MSTRTVQTVPWFMVNESGFDKDTIDESGIEKAGVSALGMGVKGRLAPQPTSNGLQERD